MTFSRRFMLTAAVAAACIFSGFSTASACGHRCSRGFSRYAYARPVYRQVQPVIRHVQPVAPVQPLVPVQPVGSIQNGQPLQQFQPQGLQPMAPGPQTPVSQMPTAGRPPGGGQPSQGIPAPAHQQPLRTVGPSPEGTNQGTRPPSQIPAAGDARMSALQALGGFAPPAVSPEPARQTAPQAAHVGQWSAAAGKNAVINLTLNGDGTFLWRAVNDSGSASDFSGRYQIDQGRLTLTRSTDGQNLAGSMQQTDSGTFRFQAAGTNAAALTFSRN